jgi:AraC-like DNA-binding protein
MDQGRPLVDVAAEAGFADQAHFTRAFRSRFGLTPGRYRALRLGARSDGRRSSSGCADHERPGRSP